MNLSAEVDLTGHSVWAGLPVLCGPPLHLCPRGGGGGDCTPHPTLSRMRDVGHLYSGTVCPLGTAHTSVLIALVGGPSWALGGLSSIPGPAHMMPGAPPVMTATGFLVISPCPLGAGDSLG